VPPSPSNCALSLTRSRTGRQSGYHPASMGAKRRRPGCWQQHHPMSEGYNCAHNSRSMFCCVLTHNQNDGNGKKFQQTWLSHFFSEGGLGEKRPGSGRTTQISHNAHKNKKLCNTKKRKKREEGLRARASEGFGRVSREKNNNHPTHIITQTDRPLPFPMAVVAASITLFCVR